jgi:uncharacterized protein DUF1206
MSSLTSQARATGGAWFERLTRAGLAGYGVIHLLFAYLILQIAFGTAAADGDQSGALQRLAARPWGATLIVLLVVGMVAMTAWQVLEAATGHRAERGRHRLYERVVSGGRAAFYTYLAWTGVKVLKGKKTSTADMQEQASQDLMASTGGRVTVGLAGLVVVAIGAGLVLYGVTRKFEKHLLLGRMTARVRRLSRPLGVTGYTAKGVSYGIAGALLVVAALRYDPDRARGLDAALRAMAHQPYGRWLLVVTALGFVAYGLFGLVQSRYRKV